MPPPLAALATAGSRAFLALCPALAGYVAARLTPAGSARRALAAAAAFALAEWLRSFVLHRLPVALARLLAAAGRARSRATRRSAAYSWSRSRVALAAALARARGRRARDAGARRAARCSPAGVLALGAGGALLAQRSSGRRPPAPRSPSRSCRATSRRTLKFDPAFRERLRRSTSALVASRAAGASSCCPRARSRCSPTRCPAGVLLRARGHRAQRATATCWSACSRRAAAAGERRAALSTTASCASASARTQLYRKRHLVPFGETIPAGAGRRLVHPPVLAIPLADQTPGAGRPAAARRRRPARRGQHLLRGRVRRRAARRRRARRRCSSTSPTMPGTAARSPPAAQPDRGDARARDRAADAARDEHRHHVGDRPRRARDRAAALVHARHPRGRGRRAAGHDAVRALRRCASARRCGTGARCRGGRGRASARQSASPHRESG